MTKETIKTPEGFIMLGRRVVLVRAGERFSARVCRSHREARRTFDELAAELTPERTASEQREIEKRRAKTS